MPKNFDLASSEEDREVIDTFTLDEHIAADPDADPDSPAAQDRTIKHEFTLLKPADSAKLMSLQLASRMHDSASDETKWNAMRGVIDYLGACLSAAEYETLYNLLVNPRSRGMDLQPMFEFCRWVLEVTTARPTLRSTGSRGGRSAAGRNSRDASSRTAGPTLEG